MDAVTSWLYNHQKQELAKAEKDALAAPVWRMEIVSFKPLKEIVD